MNKFLKKIKERTRVRTRIKKAFSTMNQILHPVNKVLETFYSDVFGRFHKKTVLFIIGVQRSGTSALFHNLSKDKRIKPYNEFSELSV